MSLARAFVALAFLSVSGCATSLGEAKSRLDEGRPGEALAVLDRARQPGSGPHERARFALVRGLSLLATGDVDAATRWLGALHERLLVDPWLLDADDLASFDAAWTRLGEPERR